MYHENYSKRHESRVLETFKYFVLADTGIDLDFRSYGYAENGHNLTPAYSYSIAASLVDSVLKFWDRFGVDIDGRYNRDLMIESLQTTRLKTAIEQWLVSEISEALFDDAEENKINFVAYSVDSTDSSYEAEGYVQAVSTISKNHLKKELIKNLENSSVEMDEVSIHTVYIKSVITDEITLFDESDNRSVALSVSALIDSVQHTATFNVQLCGTEYEPQNGCWFTTNGEDLEFSKNERLIESCFDIIGWAESEARASAKSNFTYHDTNFHCAVAGRELFAREDSRDGRVTLALVNQSHNSTCDYGSAFDERESFGDLDSAMAFLKPFRTDDHIDYHGLSAYINNDK